MYVERDIPRHQQLKDIYAENTKTFDLVIAQYLQRKPNKGRMSASSRICDSVRYYSMYRSQMIRRIYPSSRVGDVHDKPSSLRSEEIYEEVIAGP